MGTRLKDKVALITGGGGGIGEATAQLFWEEGARVAIVDVNARDAENASRGIDAGGERLLAIGADLAVEGEARRAVQETVSAFGGLHVLANVAGVRIPQGTVADLTAEAWEFIIGANLMSAVYCSKYAVPEIAKVGGGSIVHVSSSGAIIPRSGWAPYDATKSALLALTQDMAWDHAGQNIRVNAVCPGSTLTRFHIRNRARIKGISYEQATRRASGGRRAQLNEPAGGSARTGLRDLVPSLRGVLIRDRRDVQDRRRSSVQWAERRRPDSSAILRREAAG